MEIHYAQSDFAIFLMVLFALSWAGQLLFLIGIFARVAVYRHPSPKEYFPPVSVVIAARNAAGRLLKYLPSILEQSYPEYEVVVVNDSSYDDTEATIAEFMRSYQHLRLVNIPPSDRFDGGKKFAVTLGIKAARHDRILLTDADCHPLDRGWIKAMMQSAERPSDLVLGYSPFARSKGLLNAVVRYDGLHTALHYFGFALAGIPYMGVGRNLSYTKERFFAIGGFRRHYSLHSGDDDLFVNEVAHADNTSICLDPNALIETEAKSSWIDFWRQKRRHLSTGWRYRRLHKTLLTAYPLSLLLMLGSAVALLAGSIFVLPVLSMLFLRMGLHMALVWRCSRFLGQKDLAFFAPLLEMFTLAFAAAVHFANASTKPPKWKT